MPKPKYDLSQMKEEQLEEEIQVPQLPLVERPAEPETTVTAEDRHDGDALQDLAERYGRREEKRATSLRLPPWLDDILSARVYTLKAKGFRRISRETVVIQALMQYLGVSAPESDKLGGREERQGHHAGDSTGRPVGPQS